MKKITFILALGLASISMMAQTIVSTTPENKNVILEEFTGIHCVYCPDGHKIANAIEAANSGDFFAINVHTGGYATPNAGEPDFRTTYGAGLASQSGLTGYPSGTINRHVFSGSSTAMGRGDWSAATTTTVGQASYVNIAATADINMKTRIMTVLVEGYFTGSTAPSSMKLNVAVLQNNIVGPQTGGSSNPAQALPGGLYNHMHVLRDFITGQWGINIDTTSQGTFFSRTFHYTIPNDYTGVAADLSNIEVIAYIAEGNQEIITGNAVVMTHTLPPGVVAVDMGVRSATPTPSTCDNNFTPKVWVRNHSTVAADTFNVSYTYNGGTPIVQAITTSLNGGDSVLVTFPAVNITNKVNSLSFSTDFNNAVLFADTISGNNTFYLDDFYHMPSTTIGTIYSENFENYGDYEKNIDSAIILNSGGPAFVLSKAGVTGLPYDIGGFGKSSKSYLVNFFNIKSGNTIEMMFYKLDFSGNNGYGLKFNHAYAQYQSENDRLEVMLSDDCGTTWTTVYNKAGNDLKTAPPNSSSNFFPQANEWAGNNIDLSAFNGKSDVIVKFKCTSDYGNNLYLDDIRIYNSTDVGVEIVESDNSVSIYPNPATDQLNLNVNLANSANVTYQIVNSLGQTVLENNLGNLTNGKHAQNINISALASGFYYVQINIDGSIISKKLTIK